MWFEHDWRHIELIYYKNKETSENNFAAQKWKPTIELLETNSWKFIILCSYESKSEFDHSCSLGGRLIILCCTANKCSTKISQHVQGTERGTCRWRQREDQESTATRRCCSRSAIIPNITSCKPVTTEMCCIVYAYVFEIIRCRPITFANGVRGTPLYFDMNDESSCDKSFLVTNCSSFPAVFIIWSLMYSERS